MLVVLMSWVLAHLILVQQLLVHNTKGMMEIVLLQQLKLQMVLVRLNNVLLLMQHSQQMLNAKIFHICAIQMDKDVLLSLHAKLPNYQLLAKETIPVHQLTIYAWDYQIVQISRPNLNAYLIIKFTSQLVQQQHILENVNGLVLFVEI